MMENGSRSWAQNVLRRGSLTLLILVASLAISSHLALAQLTITSVTLNGSSTVTVSPGAPITAAVTVTVGAGGIWRGTQWSIGGGSFTCANHGNHNGPGTFTDTFTVTAPSTAGTFNAQFRARETDGCSGESSITLTLPSAVTVTAGFTLTVNGAGNGSGTIKEPASGANINCSWNGSTKSGDCTHIYASGTSVTLTASPLLGATFASWSGCNSTSGTQCTVTMNANKTVTATFNQLTSPWTLTVNGAGNGSGTIKEPASGANINCSWNGSAKSGDCSNSYANGASVTLTANAASGSTFASWSGCNSTSGTQCTVTMNANKTVTATFNVSGVPGVPELSPLWIALLIALFSLLLIWELRRRAHQA